MTTHLLDIRNVTLSFAGLLALNDVSLHVDEGQIVGIIGPNGAGKSSLLNCVNNFYVPQEGQITYGGTDLLATAPSAIPRLGIARTFQGLEVVLAQTVLENVLLGRHIHSRTGVVSASFFYGKAQRDEKVQRAAAEKTIEFCGLHDVRDVRVGNLSYGGQKLVAIARALAMEPQLLLLDEPTSGLTFSDKRSVASLLLELRRDEGVTQVVIEHDVRFIRDLCDHVFVLDFGKVIAAGTPDEVLAEPAVAEAYLGRSDSHEDEPASDRPATS